ncbi:MAG TPA: hypothetical protein VH415_00030 [Nitrososphaeraceae archaeon]|jgi:hypothetical protein
MLTSVTILNLKTNEPDPHTGVDCTFVQIADVFPVSDIVPEVDGVGRLEDLKDFDFESISIIGQRILKVGRATEIAR